MSTYAVNDTPVHKWRSSFPWKHVKKMLVLPEECFASGGGGKDILSSLSKTMAVFKGHSLFVWNHVKKMPKIQNEQLTQSTDGKINNVSKKKPRFGGRKEKKYYACGVEGRKKAAVESG